MSKNGIRESELVKLGNCAVCNKSLLTQGKIGLFYRVKIERHGFDAAAVHRAAGLHMHVGPLATIMGPDEELTTRIDGPVDRVVHEECAFSVHHLLMLFPQEDDNVGSGHGDRATRGVPRSVVQGRTDVDEDN